MPAVQWHWISYKKGVGKMTKSGTMRDIKRSLDVTRNQRVPSVASVLEEEVKDELEKEFGPLITEETVQREMEKERRRVEKQDLALRKAKWNILRMKAKGKTIQQIRDDLNNERLSNPSVMVKGAMEKTRGIKGAQFNEISFEY